MRALGVLLLVLALIAGGVNHARAITLGPEQPLTHATVVDLVEREFAPALEGRLAIEIDQPRLPLNNQSTSTTEIRLRKFERDPRGGGFAGALLGWTPDGQTFTLDVRGRAVELVEVPVVNRRVERGEVLTDADLDWLEVPATRLPRAALLAEHLLIGGEARRTLVPQRVLTSRDVGQPLLVRRGRPVRLVYAAAGLVITTLGTAQDDGAQGTLVRVANMDTRRQVQGRVTGPDEVTVATGQLLTDGGG